MYLYEKDDQVAQSLLDCIMNKELSRTGNKKDYTGTEKKSYPIQAYRAGKKRLYGIFNQ